MFQEEGWSEDPVLEAIVRARVAFDLSAEYKKCGLDRALVSSAASGVIRYLVELLPECAYILGDIIIETADYLEVQLKGGGLGLAIYEFVVVGRSNVGERFILDIPSGRVLHFQMTYLGSCIHHVKELPVRHRKEHFFEQAEFVFDSIQHFFLYVEDIALNPEDLDDDSV